MVNPLSKYRDDSLRICRAGGLSRQDAQRVLKFALQHLGFEYDLRQLLDLARFLFPYSVIPRRWRSSLFRAQRRLANTVGLFIDDCGGVRRR